MKNTLFIKYLIIVVLFFAPLISKAIHVEDFIYYATGNQYIGALQVIINDLSIYLVLFLSIYISFIKLVPPTISIFIRIITILLFFTYIADYLIIINFNTHLTIQDAFNYISYTPQYILQAFINFNLRTIVLLISCSYLTISFIINKWKLKYKLINHVIIISVIIICINLLSYIPKDKYVHSWLYKNFIDYNRTILSESRQYSSQFINEFQYTEEILYSLNRKQKPNIILLVVESLSSYQSRLFSGIRNWTPSLDSIAIKNIAFTNFFSNGFCSEDGINTLLFGKLPIFPPGNFTDGGSTTGYLKLDIDVINNALPVKLKKQGYHTEFITSYDLNYKGRLNFANSIGFDYIEGVEHEFYNNWPRYQYNAAPDEALYQRVLKRVKSNNSKPYFFSVFTISSHHPFTNPENGNKSEAEVFKYVDKQIGYFYRELEKYNFFENGLLLIVGDHRAMIPLKKEEIEIFGYSRAPAMIPLVIASENLNPKIITKYHQQLDIYNSLSQINLDSTHYSLWGGNIFSDDNNSPHYIAHRRGDNRDIISIFTSEQDYRVKLDGDNTKIVEGTPSSDEIRSEIINRINLERIPPIN